MHQRVIAEIDLRAIRHNIETIRAIVGPGIDTMAIVKADGYGHGAIDVARTALAAGATWLGVATVEEGITLRREFPDARIGHLPPFTPDACDEIVHSRLTPFISDEAGLSGLSQAAIRQNLPVDVHLEVDTGMGRSGALPNEAARVADAAGRLPGVRLTGLATHFAAAESDADYTRRQIHTFDQVRQEIGKRHALHVVHAANSPATLLYPAARYNLVRPGLLVYGILPALPPEVAPPDLVPALSLKSRICLIRTLPAGQSLSYSRTRTLRRDSRIATLPVGYGDGYPRGLSNLGEALVCGRRAHIVGRVCMDVMLLDVTDIPDATVGSEVVLIGRQGGAEIRVEELAQRMGTTEHEITTRLSPRVERVYLDRSEPP